MRAFDDDNNDLNPHQYSTYFRTVVRCTAKNISPASHDELLSAVCSPHPSWAITSIGICDTDRSLHFKQWTAAAAATTSFVPTIDTSCEHFPGTVAVLRLGAPAVIVLRRREDPGSGMAADDAEERPLRRGGRCQQGHIGLPEYHILRGGLQNDISSRVCQSRPLRRLRLLLRDAGDGLCLLVRHRGTECEGGV
jgi:hypothetical protein